MPTAAARPASEVTPLKISKRFIRMVARIQAARQRKQDKKVARIQTYFKAHAKAAYPTHTPQFEFCCMPSNAQDWFTHLQKQNLLRVINIFGIYCFEIKIPLRITEKLRIDLEKYWTCSNIAKNIYCLTPAYFETLGTAGKKFLTLLKGASNV